MELRGQQALELPARLNLRLALALLALALAAPAVAAAQTGPSYDADGNLIQTPFVPQGDEGARLTEEQAIATALADPKIAGWIERYKGEKFTKQATFKEAERVWQVKVWVPGKAGQIVEAKVEDATGLVKDPWTGPQVAWGMARGNPGAFGGQAINSLFIWLAFCAVFFVGPRRLAPAPLGAQPRPARAALVLHLARVLQPRRDLPRDAARLSTAALPAGAAPLGRVGAPPDRGLAARVAGVAAGRP